jgi:uracil-DNA glycosylase family 4
MSWHIRLAAEIGGCRRCARLVAYRAEVAREKVRRYRDWDYWGRPVPSFGDPMARLLVIGLAPAAHGANRTGRMFTGDRSGEWLYEALHRAGFASQPRSADRSDGLRLHDCYITAAIHCAPPRNKPSAEELAACRPYLIEELRRLEGLRVVIALGQIAFNAYLGACRALSVPMPSPAPRFAHGASYGTGAVTLIGCYHPSQQNTFTGRLTHPMFQAVFEQARAEIDTGPAEAHGRRPAQ